MALLGGLDAAAMGQPSSAQVQRYAATPDIDSLAKNFERVGFGSPVA